MTVMSFRGVPLFKQVDGRRRRSKPPKWRISQAKRRLSDTSLESANRATKGVTFLVAKEGKLSGRRTEHCDRFDSWATLCLFYWLGEKGRRNVAGGRKWEG